ncbi:MAG: mercury(II) reductase [Candidatus Nanopelagicales bacterium]
MAYDLLVIGSGSAAFAAGIEARALGASVGLVERGTLGGTCVNVGCVPSKALLAAAEAAARARWHPFAGVDTALRGVDLATVVDAKDELVAGLRQAKYADVAAAHGIDLVPGTARFVDAGTVAVDGRRLSPGSVVIATGAQPAVPAIPGLDAIDYLTSTTAMGLRALPARLVVIGAGFVGAEQAQLFAGLGSDVTLVGPLLAGAEPDLAALLGQALRDHGITRCGAKADRIDRAGPGIVVHCDDGTTATGDQVLIATGRMPRTGDLGLDRAGVATDATGHVTIDATMRTTSPRVFAAGDVTTGPQFVYVAAAMGRTAARNALSGTQHSLDYEGLPHVAFTSPQLAWSGLTEAQARRLGHTVQTRTLPLAQVPRAIVARQATGAIKLVIDARSRRLLGAHVLADHGGELLYPATIAIKAGWTIDQLAGTWAPYLTMSEGLKLAAQSFTTDITTMSCCP